MPVMILMSIHYHVDKLYGHIMPVDINSLLIQFISLFSASTAGKGLPLGTFMYLAVGLLE